MLFYHNNFKAFNWNQYVHFGIQKSAKTSISGKYALQLTIKPGKVNGIFKRAKQVISGKHMCISKLV